MFVCWEMFVCCEFDWLVSSVYVGDVRVFVGSVIDGSDDEMLFVVG